MNILPKLVLEEEEDLESNMDSDINDINDINDISDNDNDSLEIVTPDYKKENKQEKDIFLIPSDTILDPTLQTKKINLKRKPITSKNKTKEQMEEINKKKTLKQEQKKLERERLRDERNKLKQELLAKKLEQQAKIEAEKEFKSIQREKKKQEKIERQKIVDENRSKSKVNPDVIPDKEPVVVNQNKSFDDFLSNYKKYEEFKNMILENERKTKKRNSSKTQSDSDSISESSFSQTSSDDTPVFRYDYLNRNSNRRRF